VRIKDLQEFNNWLHVISYLVVVKVFAGNDTFQRDDFKAAFVNLLRESFGLTLTCVIDNSTLSRNQINVFVSAMSQALYSLEVQIYRVSFNGMKWEFLKIE